MADSNFIARVFQKHYLIKGTNASGTSSEICSEDREETEIKEVVLVVQG